MEKPKSFYIYKKLDVPAKIIGLNYNTFFIFLMISAIMVMVSSSKGLTGFAVALVLIGVTYLALFFVQTKLGPKIIAKKKADFFDPIRLIKMKKSIKKIDFDEFR